MRQIRRVFTAALVAVTLATGLAACGSTSDKPGPDVTSASGSVFPVTVGALTLDKRPERIVSLSSTSTEMLFAIDAGKQVVAVDEFSTFPVNAPKTDLSAYKPNAEAIATYSPDLVVIASDMEKITEQLKTLKIPTFLAPAAQTLDDSYAQIRDLGRLTGHTAEAEALAANIRDEVTKLVQDLPKRTKPLTYYYELDQTYYSVTSATFIGSLFTSAGLVNIADEGNKDNAYPQLSAEAIIKASPDLIFLADTRCCGQSGATVGARPGWGTITAVKNNQVVALDDDIASRWGPRVVDLLRAVTDAVAKIPAA